jgi:hypothetical protein
MPLDPSIPLSATKPPDPLESAARIFTIKAAMQQAQMGDYELHDQLTLRDASGMPDVKNPDGTMNIGALLGHVTGKVSPKTMITLTSAAQQQQQFQQQQQKQKQDQMQAFFKASADPMASIYTEFQKDSKDVGPEKAWEIAQPKTEALRTQLSQTFQGMNLQPMKSPDQLQEAARHSQSYLQQQLKAPDRALKEREVQARERSVAVQEKKADAGISGKGALSEDALNMAADQYLAGDSTAAQGYARNAQMKSQLTNKIAERAKSKGMSGEDVAAKVAEFQGIKAGERSAGTRTAQVGMAVNEAQRMIPLALDASEKASRSGIKSFNDIQQAVQKGTASPDLRKFVAANNSLVNVYSRAVSPTGTPTVSDKDHAREVLSTGFSKGDYKAAVDQLQKEMEAAQASPGDVRKEFRKAVTGKEEGPKRKKYNPTTDKFE